MCEFRVPLEELYTRFLLTFSSVRLDATHWTRDGDMASDICPRLDPCNEGKRHPLVENAPIIRPAKTSKNPPFSAQGLTGLVQHSSGVFCVTIIGDQSILDTFHHKFDSLAGSVRTEPPLQEGFFCLIGSPPSTHRTHSTSTQLSAYDTVVRTSERARTLHAKIVDGARCVGSDGRHPRMELQ